MRCLPSPERQPLRCTTLWFCVFTGWRFDHSSFRTFHNPKVKPHPHEQSLVHMLTTRNPLPVSVDRPVLDVSRQGNHTMCVLLCLLLSLSKRILRVRPMVASVRVLPLLVAELVGCTVCVCLLWVDRWVLCSSVAGSSSVHCVHRSVWTCVLSSLWWMPGCGISGPRGNS